MTDPREATHLVMTRLVRTCKLLQCLVTVKHIVSSSWIVDSAKAGEFLDCTEERYRIRDTEFEATFDCDIHGAVVAPDRDRLFAGRTFYITPSVRPSVKELTKLIELAGGKVERNRRSAIKIHEANSAAANSYLILASPQDLHLLPDLTRNQKQCRIICTSEFVMKSVMCQSIVDIEPHIIKCI